MLFFSVFSPLLSVKNSCTSKTLIVCYFGRISATTNKWRFSTESFSRTNFFFCTTKFRRNAKFRAEPLQKIWKKIDRFSRVRSTSCVILECFETLLTEIEFFYSFHNVSVSPTLKKLKSCVAPCLFGVKIWENVKVLVFKKFVCLSFGT